MKILFHIPPSQDTDDIYRLLLEIGTDYCSYAFLNSDETISSLKYFVIEEWEVEQCVQTMIDEIRNKNFGKVIVCSGYPYAIVTPLKYSVQSDSLLKSIYDEPEQYYLNDIIGELRMVNAYSLPVAVFQTIKKAFPFAQFIHAYTPALQFCNKCTDDNQIYLHFTTHYFRVMVKKNGMMHLVQMYAYKTPLDVVYYLLKICAELNFNQSEGALVLSGLIEEESPLYQELYNYFLNIHFAKMQGVSFAQQEYPQHFFTSTYNLAACAS